MVTHPNFFPGLGLLNFSDLTNHFHCPNFWLMLVLCTIEVFNLGILLSLCEVKLTKTREEIRIGDHFASTIIFSLAEILGNLGKFVSSTGISKKPDYVNLLPLHEHVRNNILSLYCTCLTHLSSGSEACWTVHNI